MSIPKIRAALEVALSGITPELPTVFENIEYAPITGTAYQRVSISFAAPNNEEYGPNWQELGIMHIGLFYPQSVGPSESDERFELIRTTFARGNSFTSGGVIVTINGTPELTPGYNDGNYFVRPVRVRFYANINL